MKFIQANEDLDSKESNNKTHLKIDHDAVKRVHLKELQPQHPPCS